jgi:hypothetical protein
MFPMGLRDPARLPPGSARAGFVSKPLAHHVCCLGGAFHPFDDALKEGSRSPALAQDRAGFLFAKRRLVLALGERVFERGAA